MAESWTLGVSVIASLLAVLMTMSLGVDVQEIIRNGSTENKNFLPFIAILTNSAVTCYYGAFIHDKPVMLVNAINTVFAAVFCAVFYRFAHSDQIPSIRKNALVAAAFSFSTVTYSSQFISEKEAVTFLGVVSNLLTVFMFASPLSNLITIWKSRDASSISSTLAVMSLACSLSWLYYGFLVDNVFIMLPNLFGTVTSLVQLLFCHLFPGPSLPTSVNMAILKEK